MGSQRRILIVRPSALGDVARTVPALVSLKRAFPEADIDWLVNEAFADAVAHHPDLHAVVPFPRARLARFGWSPSATREGLRYFAALRRRGYDAVYDLQGLGRSGWLAWVTGAAHRVGPADARELGWLGYHRRVRIPPEIVHTVDRMLAVLQGDGIRPVREMRLYTPPADRQWADEWLASRRLAGSRYAVLAPGAAWDSKRWPAEKFDTLAAQLADEGFEAHILVGSEKERSQAGPLLRQAPNRINLMGQTTVGQLMAVIETAELIVANDSAPLHLAVGLGRRCVGIFGPTDPARVGPYNYPAGVVAASDRGPVNYRSIDSVCSSVAGISVEQVVEKIRYVLRAPPPGD